MKVEGAHGTRELEGLVRREVLELALEELSLVLLASTHKPKRGVRRGHLICGYLYSRAVTCAPRRAIWLRGYPITALSASNWAVTAPLRCQVSAPAAETT